MTQTNNEREKLDVRYFNEKLRLVLEGLPNYTRSELARELQRLSNTASPISQNQQTKQIPDGWKPLSNKQIAEVREYMITDGCLDTVEFANAIYTKLKHINTTPTTSLTSETNTEVGE